jgi:hypothetical protein
MITVLEDLKVVTKRNPFEFAIRIVSIRKAIEPAPTLQVRLSLI